MKKIIALMSICLIILPILTSCGKTETTSQSSDYKKTTEESEMTFVSEITSVSSESTTTLETSTASQIAEEAYVMIYDSDNTLHRAEYTQYYESRYDFENHPEKIKQLGVDPKVFSRSYTIPCFNMIYDKYQNEIQNYFISMPEKYGVDMNNLDSTTEVCNVTYEINNISKDAVSMNVMCEYYKKDDDSKYKIYTETLDLSSDGVFNIKLKNKE